MSYFLIYLMAFKKNSNAKNYGVIIPDFYLQRVLNAIEILPMTPLENKESQKRLEGVLVKTDYVPDYFLQIELNANFSANVKIQFESNLEPNTGYLMPPSMHEGRKGEYLMRIPSEEIESQRKSTYFHELIELYLMFFYMFGENKYSLETLNRDERHNISKNYTSYFEKNSFPSEKQLEFKF